MRRLPAVIFACAVAAGQSPLSAPAWLSPYPGASADTRTLPSLIESTYQTKDAPAAVIAHYGKLFESAGLLFAPTFDGMGTVVRGSPPECDLLIKIREQSGGAFVRVSCAVKTPAMTAVPAPSPAAKLPAAPSIQSIQRSAVERAEEASRNRIAEMRKFDEPVQTKPRTAPNWPAWLVDPAGGKPPVRRTSADSLFLSSSFAVSGGDPAAVQTFYTDLLESHGCSVSGRGRSWLESSCRLDARSATVLIVRAELSPTPEGTQVQLRVSSIP
jgi:hypothetical protein